MNMPTRPKPNLMRTSALAALSIVCAPALFAAAQAAPSFTAYDSNADGNISLEEFQAQGGSVKTFHEVDANRDLQLSKDELAQASAATRDRTLPGKYLDDAWITAKVKALLLKDEIVKGLNVNVETTKGTVQLSGWVSDEKQIAQAEQIARGIEGVKQVRNDLQIKRD